jgi:hypothetical protein
VAMLGQGDEIAQVTQVHVGDSSGLSSLWQQSI